MDDGACLDDVKERYKIVQPIIFVIVSFSWKC